MGFSVVSNFQGERVHEKPIWRGNLPKNGGLGQFADLRGGVGKKRKGCFWGGVFIPPMQTMSSQNSLKVMTNYYEKKCHKK